MQVLCLFKDLKKYYLTEYSSKPFKLISPNNYLIFPTHTKPIVVNMSALQIPQVSVLYSTYAILKILPCYLNLEEVIQALQTSEHPQKFSLDYLSGYSSIMQKANKSTHLNLYISDVLNYRKTPSDKKFIQDIKFISTQQYIANNIIFYKCYYNSSTNHLTIYA